MKLAAVGDLHCSRSHVGFWAPRLRPVSDEADILLLAGDLTLTGDPQELRVLLDELAAVSIPIIAVLGNHDYASGRARVIAESLRRARIQHLEGSTTTVGNVAIVGAMGIDGGFAPRRWNYAEKQIMARLQHYLTTAAEATRRVGLLHYAPILATLAGEPDAMVPLLGSSALESAIDAAGADLVLHGHAHYGSLTGHTRSGVPVFNVALPVLERAGYTMPYRIFDLYS